jgi:hypothetical protein
MIPLCSRFDSVLFTPKMFRIASYGDYSRSPSLFYPVWDYCIVYRSRDGRIVTRKGSLGECSNQDNVPSNFYIRFNVSTNAMLASDTAYMLDQQPIR